MEQISIEEKFIKSFGLKKTHFEFYKNKIIRDEIRKKIIQGHISIPVILKIYCNIQEIESYKYLLSSKKCNKKNSEFGIPKIFFIDSDTKSVGMENILGETLSSALLSKEYNALHRHSLVNRCGRWLSWFHNFETVTCKSFPAEDFLESLNREISSYTSIEYSLAARIFSSLEKTATLASKEIVPHGLLHGDFKPDNLIVSTSRVVGIDFQINTQGMLISDLVQFLNHIYLFGYEPRALRSRLWREKAALECAFLRGYETQREKISRLALSWLQIHHLCRMACNIQRRTKGLRRRYLLAIIDRELERLRCRLEALSVSPPQPNKY